MNNNKKKGVRIKKYKNGTISYMYQEDKISDKKLIFMKLNSKKDIQKNTNIKIT